MNVHGAQFVQYSPLYTQAHVGVFSDWNQTCKLLVVLLDSSKQKFMVTLLENVTAFNIVVHVFECFRTADITENNILPLNI